MSTSDAPNLRRLARQLADYGRRLRHLETVPQLSNSSLDDHGMPVYDADGNLSVTLGKQPDGTYSARPVRGPIPPAPAGLDAEGDAGLIHASWQGVFWAGAAMPRDFEAVEVLVDGSVHGAIHDPDGGSVTVPAFAGEREVSFRTLSQAGRRSDDTGHVTVTVQSKASVQLDEARGRIEDAEGALGETQVRLDQAEQTVASTAEDLTRVETEVIPGAVADLEAADQAAQDQFAELNGKLGDFATDESLGPIREALAEAQDAVDAAKSIAETANQAANAASQAALEAAGIAASKGRVIIQETEPVGEDRNAANIWIKPIPDDPTTEIEEKAITYVYLEGSNEWVPTSSDELAQAAQNALDAREAAEQAKQRAETAITNAAAAKEAARDAQRTADQATLDARDAHNEAVSAQERVEAKIASGDSLVLNGSFEVDDTNWGAVEGRFKPIESADAHTGARVMELTPATVNAYPLSDPFPVTEGHTYQVRMWYRYMPGDRASRLSAYYQQRDKAGDLVRAYYATDEEGKSILLFADDLVEDEWTLFAGLIEIDPGVTHLRVAPHALGASTDVFHIDDVQVVDVTEARRAQARADEAYTEAASKATSAEVEAAASAAEQAAKTAAAADAKAKADQAKADALAGAATDAKSKADAAKAAAIAAASADAATKANKALQDALAALADARGEITAEIVASANGKNSITRSTSAASGKGVVVGDLWVQVDSAGDAFRQWYWDGSAWKPAQIKSDMLESLDVHKLQVTGSATMDEAVIDKLFAETFAAHKITASELLVSGAMNLIPGVRPGSNYGLSDFTWDENEKALRTTGRTGIYSDESLTLPPGEYLVSADIKASVDGTRTYVGLHGGDDVGWNYRYGISNVAPTTEWQHFEAGLSIPEGDEGSAKLRVLPAYSGDDTATTWYRNISLRPMTGAVLIEDGAITTPKLTVTEDMSAAIVDAMSVNTKKLVVTEEAILNHATLIGQTVVDDINVQGKLIGTDGVFTGTVDFTNVNVTGEQVVNKLAANSIEADKIKGGSFAGKTFEGGSFRGGEFQAPAVPRWNGGIAISAAGGIQGWDYEANPSNPEKILQLGSSAYPNFVAGSMSTAPMGKPGAILTPVTGSGGRVGGGVWFSTDGSTGRDQAAIYSYLDGNIHIRPKDTLPKGTVFIDGNLMVGDKTTFSSTLSAESITSFGTIATMKPGRGTSSTANTIIESGTGVLRMTASSRRYKQEIEDWVPSPEDVLKLRPRSWKERKGLRPDMPDYQDPNRYVGFIAEEVADAGLEELVVFADDEEGNYGPDNLNYDRIPAAQQVVLQDHEARILELEGENRDLRSRLAAIEERLTGDNHV